MNKKVFISYSWGNKEHQNWIINLGKRLLDDTVDVILDKWSLKEGQDIYSFMESMVKAGDIFRVLVICNEDYKVKADNRDGGVGTETQIITPEIYKNQEQEKFIPIVVERTEKDEACLPIYLSSRKYLDFSKEEYFEDSYEELLRNILETPALPKPKLGAKVPRYISESSVNTTRTNSILRSIKRQIEKTPEKVNGYSSDFLKAFLEDLRSFQLDTQTQDLEEFGKELLNNLNSFKEIREDFIGFVLNVSKPEFQLDVDVLINFFEKKPNYTKPREGTTSYRSTDFDNFKIIFQELFLYTITCCLKNKNYFLIENLLHSKYYFKNDYSSKSETYQFGSFAEYHRNLEEYQNQKFNKITGFGDYLVGNLSDKVRKEDLIIADLLCHFIAELFADDFVDTWFPTTYLYRRNLALDFFDRLSSKRHFNKCRGIFDCQSPEDLKTKLLAYKESKEGEQRMRYSRGFNQIPYFHEIVDPEKIAIHR